MTIKKGAFSLSAIIFFAVSGFCHASESAIAKEFSDALLKKDAVRMNAVIGRNKDKIPAEIKAILDDAFLPQTKAEERESRFNLAERLARQYKNLTGDEGPLMDEQKRVFESYLAGAVTPVAVEGVHTVEIRHPEDGKMPFSPDNMIIKKGEAVRWVNNDTEAHLLSTVSGISADKMVSANIEPGKSWEHRFYKPGAYYYICCIHKVKMYGKITVE